MTVNRRRFLLLSGSAVAAATAAGGYIWRRRRRVPATPVDQHPPLATQTLRELRDEEFDIIIIGSGIAGAVLAESLAQAGLRSAVIESGHHPRSPANVLAQQLEIFENAGDIDYPLLATRVRALGGTTNIWTGRCRRFEPIDFDANPYAEAVAPWPIGYAQIEPWYERAEQTLLVRGGLYSKFSPPRKNRLPAFIATPSFPELAEFLGKRDIQPEAYPSSQVSRADLAPFRCLKNMLPRLAASPHITLVSGATTTQLLANVDGAVTTATVQSLTGETRQIRAKIFIVAAGAVESARLLLLSRSQTFPQGLGNSHDQVGRYFMEDIARKATVRIPRRKVGHTESAWCYQFYKDFAQRGMGGLVVGFRQQKEFPDRLQISRCMNLRLSPQNRITLAIDKRDAFDNPVAKLSLSLTPEDARALAAGTAQLQRLCTQLGAVDFSEQEPLDYSHHHMGTCRMGADPRTSVVNADLRLHDSPNAYVLSSGVFSSAGAGHPTVLIVALAHRLADHLIAALKPAAS